MERLRRHGPQATSAASDGLLPGSIGQPIPIILPDPDTLFARRAARLTTLSEGHVMAEWLGFLARLSCAQQEAAIVVLSLAATPAAQGVESAVELRLPPLARGGLRPDAAWRDGLLILLRDADLQAMRGECSAAVARLQASNTIALETLADSYLRGALEADQAGAALYVAAALQVYFACRAAALPVQSLRLLEQRGLCPCCGSAPVSAVVTAAGSAPGARYLHCSLCGTAWNHVRAICITCGDARALNLREIEGSYYNAAKAETCDACGTYVKMFYQAKDMQVDPVADDVATLGLDVLVAEAGWSRHAAHPLILSGLV